MFKVNKVYAAIAQTQMVAICFYMLPFEKKIHKQTNKQNPCHCLFLLFYYKRTKVLYNLVLYKLVS